MDKMEEKHDDDDMSEKFDLLLDEMKYIRAQSNTIVSSIKDIRLELTAFKEKIEQDVSAVKHNIDTVKDEIEEVLKLQQFHSVQYDGFKRATNNC